MHINELINILNYSWFILTMYAGIYLFIYGIKIFLSKLLVWYNQGNILDRIVDRWHWPIFNVTDSQVGHEFQFLEGKSSTNQNILSTLTGDLSQKRLGWNNVSVTLTLFQGHVVSHLGLWILFPDDDNLANHDFFSSKLTCFVHLHTLFDVDGIFGSG